MVFILSFSAHRAPLAQLSQLSQKVSNSLFGFLVQMRMKTFQVRVRVSGDHIDLLRTWADSTGLTQQTIVQMLLHASIVAAKNHRGALPFPLAFKVELPETDPARSPRITKTSVSRQ